MGVTAENIAQVFKIDRQTQDEFAAGSQQRAEAAQNANKFADEIVAVEIPQRKGDPLVFDTDEFPSHGTTTESLGKLRPAFNKEGSVTAGNASGLNNGAAVVMETNYAKEQELGLDADKVNVNGGAIA